MIGVVYATRARDALLALALYLHHILLTRIQLASCQVSTSIEERRSPMKRMSRLALLVALLFVAGWLPASEAHAGWGYCSISCHNGITAEGWSESFDSCLQSAVANCNQGGWYGGTFCYYGDAPPWEQGCWTW
jgi:hypothetical protein